jgi:hypothetical protein
MNMEEITVAGARIILVRESIGRRREQVAPGGALLFFFDERWDFRRSPIYSFYHHSIP